MKAYQRFSPRLVKAVVHRRFVNIRLQTRGTQNHLFFGLFALSDQTVEGVGACERDAVRRHHINVLLLAAIVRFRCCSVPAGKTLSWPRLDDESGIFFGFLKIGLKLHLFGIGNFDINPNYTLFESKSRLCIFITSTCSDKRFVAMNMMTVIVVNLQANLGFMGAEEVRVVKLSLSGWVCRRFYQWGGALALSMGHTRKTKKKRQLRKKSHHTDLTTDI